MSVFLISVAVALGVSFLCSLAEAALLSLTPSQIARLSQKHPSIGQIWQNFKSDITRPIAVILILDTSAHTIGASVAGSSVANLFGAKWIWLFSLVFTFVMVQFTDILPKSLGVRFNSELGYLLARPLSVSIRIFEPVIKIVHLLNRPFERKSPKKGSQFAIDEIAALAGLARLSKQISQHQEKIILGASRLTRLSVNDVMIPVEQVSFLSSLKSIGEAVLAAHNDFHTRYPVCRGDNRDDVIGYANFKEMIYFMKTNPKDQSFLGIIRPLHFVSPRDSAADLMKTFIEQHVHIAIVRDYSGKTLGLVTLEDIVEELVGELEDEFDRLPRMLHQLSGGTWMVGGGLMTAELFAAVPAGPAETANKRFSDWLIEKLGHTP
ncbi:MAG: CNNM domain-containing protein, partial [Sedimentisphaerales bacterium]